MPEHLDLGEWIRSAFGDQGGLASKLRPKVAKNTVSSWKTGRNGIPPDYQKQIRAMGYTGPWPREEAQDAAAGGPAPYVTRGEFEDVPGRLRRLEEDIRALLPLVQAVKDLDARVRKLAGDSGSVE